MIAHPEYQAEYNAFTQARRAMFRRWADWLKTAPPRQDVDAENAGTLNVLRINVELALGAGGPDA